MPQPEHTSSQPARFPSGCLCSAGGHGEWGSHEGGTRSQPEEADTLSPADSASGPFFLLTLVSLLVGFWPPSVSPLSLGPTLEVGVSLELWNLKNLFLFCWKISLPRPSTYVKQEKRSLVSWLLHLGTQVGWCLHCTHLQKI